MWEVVFHPGAEEDLVTLPPRERVAVLNAVEKLRSLGPILPFPHQSRVRGGVDLRELRPLEGGDHEPTFATLRRLSRRLGMEFHIDISPEAIELTA